MNRIANMGRTESKNESFIAIRMEIHQKFSSAMKKIKKAMPKFLNVMWYICYCYIIGGRSLGALIMLI